MSYGNVISIQFTFFPSFGYWGQFRSLIYTACIICSFFLYACIFVYNGERAIQLIIRNRWNLYSKKPGCGRCWLQGSVYFGKKKKKERSVYVGPYTSHSSQRPSIRPIGLAGLANRPLQKSQHWREELQFGGNATRADLTQNPTVYPLSNSKFPPYLSNKPQILS